MKNVKGTGDALLNLRNISVEFDGFKAVNNVETSIAPNQIHFFIGPNGAGKTTLLDVICGKTKPSAGEVEYAGVGNILKLKEFEIVKQGICRKFRVPLPALGFQIVGMDMGALGDGLHHLADILAILAALS